MYEFRYCPVCSKQIEKRMIDHRKRLVCTSCGFVHYLNPAPAAGVIILEKEMILLVRRKFEPRKGMWCIPAGFIEADEDVRDCAVRELKEETFLDVELQRLFGVYSAFDDPRTSAVLILFEGRMVGGELRCGDDASEAKYFPLNDLPSDIAFDAHRRALEDLREKLKLR